MFRRSARFSILKILFLRPSIKLVALLCFLSFGFSLITYETSTSSGIHVSDTRAYSKILAKLPTDSGDQTETDRKSGVLSQFTSILFSLCNKAGTMLLGEKKSNEALFNIQPYVIDVTKFLRRELGQNWTVGGNFSCRQTNISTVKFPICLYSYGEDKWVSGAFRSNRYWEEDHVLRIVCFFQRISIFYNNSVGFIDIGANIGAYTLAVAHMGYPVLAIEPNKATITRLASSVYRGNLTKKVELRRVGVSNKRGTFQLRADKTNRGNTYLSNCLFNSSANMTKPFDAEARKDMFLSICMNDSVSTVLMDDLTDEVPHRIMIMKIDIQCAEIQALSQITSSIFFKVNYVPLILMEWECYGPGYSKFKDIGIQHLMSYLTASNYTPHCASSGKPMSLEKWSKYTGSEVVLMKNDICGNISWT